MQLSRKASKVIHPLEPIFNQDSKILILGSMPSVKSREIGFYYSHPQNKFWNILSEIYQEDISNDIISRKDFLLKHQIALWDVIKSCTIIGSNDSSIKDVKINNINFLLKNSSIEKIFTTGKKAYSLYQKYIFPKTKIEAIPLPSTSPLNAAMKYEDIIKEYKKIVY